MTGKGQDKMETQAGIQYSIQTEGRKRAVKHTRDNAQLYALEPGTS